MTNRIDCCSGAFMAALSSTTRSGVGLPLAAVLLAFSLIGPAFSDEVLLFSGDTLVGRVVRYEKSTVTIVDDAGQATRVPVLEVKRINFDEPTPPDADADADAPPADRPTPRHETLLAERIEQAKASLAARGGRPSAVVAMYLDTEDFGETPPQGDVEYRCYTSSGGYTGSVRAPLREAWTRVETIWPGRDGACRIQIDAGPPYKIVNRQVILEAGGVANLGRVVLPKVQAEGTASVVGFVTDGAGQAVEGALVRGGGRSTRTGADGGYRLDGFGLERFTLTASKPGYSGPGVRMAIRDMSRREIDRPIKLYRPRRVKLRYVVSDRQNSSFEGDTVQAGTIERIVRGERDRLGGTLFSSPRFSEFAEKASLELELRDDRVVIENRRAPLYFQPVDRGVDFDAIAGVGELSSNTQQCPPLGEGDMVLIRGFRAGRSGVADYCVKLRVEELAVVGGSP